METCTNERFQHSAKAFELMTESRWLIALYDSFIMRQRFPR